MGLFDNIRKGAIDAAKAATNAATSYIEELEAQAKQQEEERKRQQEAESERLQKLEDEKNQILEEIRLEREKLQLERDRLAAERSDPSFNSNQDSNSELVVDDGEDLDDGDDNSIDDPFEVEDNENKGDLYAGSGDDHGTLLDQLADMTAQQNELIRRCEEVGLGDKAKSIAGKSESSEVYALDPDDLGAVSFTARNVTRQFRAAMELMLQAMEASGEQQKDLMREARSALEGAEQAANDVEQLASEIEQKAREIQQGAPTPVSITEAVKYDWKRKPIYIAYGDPIDVYEKLDKLWNEISIGSRRDELGNPIEFPKHTPYATATGRSVSQGFRVPEYAFLTPIAFKNWCDTVGLTEGVALEITGTLTKPGARAIR